MLLSPLAFVLFLFLVFFLSAFFFDFWFPSPSVPLYITSLSVLCFFFYVFRPLSLVPPRSRCRHLSFVILCSAASGSGGWLLKTVKTMVNAGSRLCAFVRWAEFASPLLLVLDSVTFSSEMKGQRQWWGCSSSLCRSSAFLSPQFCFSFPVSLSLFPQFFSPPCPSWLFLLPGFSPCSALALPFSSSQFFLFFFFSSCPVHSPLFSP